VVIIKNRKIIRDFKNSDDAVVGIVVTVLLIGLILAVIIMVNTIYVPQWLENSEASHMGEVTNQFTQLKYALDLQTLVNDSTAITIPITLGTKEIPFFNTGRTFDTLEIINDAITIDFDPGESYTSDVIKFSSLNSYFVDQSFIYEAGALIIRQNDKSVLYGNVPIIVTVYGKNITFYLTEIEGLPGKTFVSGHGTYPIYTSVDQSVNDEILETNITEITITTEHPQAWENIIKQSFGEPEFDYEISTSSNQVILTFNTVNNNFYIKNKHIITQIAFGIAE
jgi:hypothetical protein